MAGRCPPTKAWINLSSSLRYHQLPLARKSMLSSRIDETADRLAHCLVRHIHNISPQHSRRRRSRNMLVILHLTPSRRRLQALINHPKHKTPNSPDRRKPSTTPMQHMLRCIRNRNRTSRTMPRRTMMATTAMVGCPCPRHTKSSAGKRWTSETTNARSPEPNTNYRCRGILSCNTTHRFACRHGR